MAKPKHIFLAGAVLVAMFAGAGKAAAQFSMNTVGQNAEVSAPMPLRHPTVKFDVVNAAKARVMRKVLWKQRNTVDFRISATGAITHFNKSWTTNNQNVVSGEIVAYYYHTYTKERHTSIFKFDGVYGMNHIDDIWFKNQDMLKLYYLSSWKLKTTGLLRNWAYSFSTTFASQFSRGFKGRAEADRNVVWSNFMAPGTLNAGLGFTYTSPDPKVPFIVTVDPVSGNAWFVLDDRIDDARRKILLGGNIEARDAGGRPIKYRVEGGSSLNVAFNRTFAFGKKDGFTLQYNTVLNSFYGWMTQAAKHEVTTTGSDGVDVVVRDRAIVPTVGWSNALILNPLKFITLEFRANMLYNRSQVDKIQMQYYLRVGLTYRYKNK